MGFKLPLLITFVTLLLASQASALTQLNIYIDESGDALFLGTTDEQIALPEGINNSNGRISGYTSSLTAKSGELWIFNYALSKSEMTIILPEGVMIKNVSSGEITIGGKQIEIFARNSVKISYVVEKADDSNLGIFVIIIIILIVFGAGYFAYFRKRKNNVNKVIRRQKTKSKLSIISRVLNDRENAIIGKLKEMGKTKMSYLKKACDMPKASFSRHVHELRKKGLVNLSGEGKNKFVELVK